MVGSDLHMRWRFRRIIAGMLSLHTKFPRWWKVVKHEGKASFFLLVITYMFCSWWCACINSESTNSIRTPRINDQTTSILVCAFLKWCSLSFLVLFLYMCILNNIYVEVYNRDECIFLVSAHSGPYYLCTSLQTN